MGILRNALPAKHLKDREKARTMLRIAQLLYSGDRVHRPTQEEIGNQLRAELKDEKLSQNRVSALRAEAEDLGIIDIRVNPPRAIQLETQLEEKFKLDGIRDVFVVPPGGGMRNEKNLGPVGANVLAAAIKYLTHERKKATVRITLSCGATLRAIVQQFLTLVQEGADLPTDVSLEVYPSTLWTDWEVKAIYPSTLVTTLRIMWPDRGLPQIKAFTASLPSNFYKYSLQQRRQYLDKYEISRLLERAATADIFCIGIGDSRDASYTMIVDQLKPDLPEPLSLKWQSSHRPVFPAPLGGQLILGRRRGAVQIEGGQ